MTTYKEAGVDITKNDRLVSFIKKIGKIDTGFADSRTIPEHGELNEIVQCTDGVGTKIRLAYREGLLGGIGQDLVAMCVNDLICVGARPAFFQDYIAANSLDEVIVQRLLISILMACDSCGVTLTGGEMAEMPRTYIEAAPELVGFATGFTNSYYKMDKNKVEVGDIVIGIPSSGPHSNGFSLINELDLPRKTILECLRSTKIYSEVVNIHFIDASLIKSAAHITGGGLEANLRRAIPDDKHVLINYQSWEVPKVFQEIRRVGQVPLDDMWNTFNMGVGMCLIVSSSNYDMLLGELTIRGYRPFKLGVVT